MEAMVYSTDITTGKKLLVEKTCAACRTNPLMNDCTCNAEMADINHPACFIVYQALNKVFPITATTV